MRINSKLQINLIKDIKKHTKKLCLKESKIAYKYDRVGSSMKKPLRIEVTWLKDEKAV